MSVFLSRKVNRAIRECALMAYRSGNHSAEMRTYKLFGNCFQRQLTSFVHAGMVLLQSQVNRMRKLKL